MLEALRWMCLEMKEKSLDAMPDGKNLDVSVVHSMPSIVCDSNALVAYPRKPLAQIVVVTRRKWQLLSRDLRGYCFFFYYDLVWKMSYCYW